MIAEACPDDAAPVIALWARCDLTRPWNAPDGDFKRAIDNRSSTILLWRDGDRIIGSVMVGDDGHRGWVYYLAVDPARRREGLGGRLMVAAEDWLRTRGVVKVQLMVREGNDAAMLFYERLGLQLQPVAVFGRFLD